MLLFGGKCRLSFLFEAILRETYGLPCCISCLWHYDCILYTVCMWVKSRLFDERNVWNEANIVLIFSQRVHKLVHYVLCFLSNMPLCFVGNTIGQKVVITGITIVRGAKLYFPQLFIPMLMFWRVDPFQYLPFCFLARLAFLPFGCDSQCRFDL